MGSGPRPLKLPLRKVREGCAALTERIHRHATDARVLLDADRPYGAYILILTGYEEIGKIFQLIEAAAKSEDEDGKEVLVRNFKEHEVKAAKSSQFMERLAIITDAAFTQVLGSDFPGQADYLDHLTAIGRDFYRLRSGLLYVDYVDGQWIRDRPLHEKFLYQDIASLDGMTKMLEDSIKKYPKFPSLWSYLTTDDDRLVSELVELLKAVLSETFINRLGHEGGENPTRS